MPRLPRRPDPPRPPRYAVLFAGAVAALATVAAYTFARLQPAQASTPPVVLGEATDTFDVVDPRLIRPPASAYQRFAAEDSAWRARWAAPSPRFGAVSAGEAAIWRPSPLQAMQDQVYLLSRQGRLAEATAVLTRWVTDHPYDADALRDLARLLNQQGRTDDAIARYHQLAALRADPATRRELAQVLLDAGRYDEAARRWAELALLYPGDSSFRWGEARALAWGNRPRDAEAPLHWLVRHYPADTTARSMLAAARASYDPPAAVAAAWVRERPDYAPYRLALARALAREGRDAAAMAELDTLLAMSPADPALLREAAGAHSAAGDSSGAARLFGRAVALAPADTALRHEYARALAWAGRRLDAIAEYDTLLRRAPRWDLLLERGRLYAWAGDLERGRRDLEQSAALHPTYDALVTLGDDYRWMGDFRRARDAYQRALALRPADATVLADLDLLARDERTMLASALSSDELGLTSLSSYAEDNSGFLYLATGVSYGVDIGRGTVASLAVEQRRVSQRSAVAPERWLFGYTVEGGLSRWLGRIVLAAKLGLARHALVHDMLVGSASAAAPVGPVRLTAEVGTGPVYAQLMSMRALAPVAADAAATPLVGRTASLGGSARVGRVEVSATGQQLWLSDGNRRASVDASVRVPLGAGFSAIYGAGALGFAQPSDRYWDPTRYTSQSLGLEYALRTRRGFSAAVRVLPGIASSEEPVTLGTGATATIGARGVPQLAASGEAGFQARRWSVTAGGGYGRGREGGYQSLQGTLQLHVIW